MMISQWEIRAREPTNSPGLHEHIETQRHISCGLGAESKFAEITSL